MPFKDTSYLELWRVLCSAEQNHLCNFGTGHNEEHFYEIILNLDQWFRRCCLKDFLSRALATEVIYAIWLRASWGTFMRNYLKFGPVVQEEMSLKKRSLRTPDQCTPDEDRSQ